MAGEPTLYARMELRLNDFEKKLARATKSTDQTMGKIERRGQQMTAKMQGIGNGAFAGLIKGAALSLAPILSVVAALNGAREALDKFSSISDSAKSSGLDAETFQELAYQAEQGGVEFATFAKSLETFNKNAGLAVVGKGKMITALKALNPELLANIQAATTQEQRIRLAADAIAAADSASQKAALSTALFGEAGAKLADVFSGGAAQIDATATAARNLGLVIDRDLIARSEQLGDELSTASQVMDLQFKQTLVELAPILIGTAKLTGDLAAGINYLTESMQALGQRGTARLEQDLAGIESTLAAASATMAPGVVGTMGIEIDPAGQAKMQSEADAIRAELKRRAIDQLRIDLNSEAAAGEPDETVYGGSNGAADSAIKHAEAVQKLVADLQFERDTLNETALEQQILNTLRSAGVDAASAEGLAIRSLVTDLESQRSAIEANASAMEAFGGATADALGTFIDDMIEGKSLAESLGGILKNLGSQLISAGLGALTGSKGLGSLFDIPGRATGGPVQAGQPYIVGEKRPELFVPSTSGRIIPRVPTVKPMSNGGGGGGTTVPISIAIDARGADGAGMARVSQQLAQLQSELPGRVKQVIRDRGRKWW